MAKDRIENRLAMAQIVIDRALSDSDIQTALVAFGYSASQLDQGKRLRDTVFALQSQQRVAGGNLAGASRARITAQRTARSNYMHQVSIARLACKDMPGALQKLELLAARKRTQAGWMLQARQFYTNALGDANLLDTLAENGLTRAKIAAGQAQLGAVDANNAIRQQHKDHARDATRRRDEALTALDTWMYDFRAIARVALKNWPELLVTLGITPRAERGATQRRTSASNPTNPGTTSTP